jgi:flagellar biosynthesis protein FlhA
MATKPKLVNSVAGGSGDWIVPALAVSMVFVMLIPLPALVVDLLLALSITAAVLVMLVAIQILKPVQFSVFPSLLLLLTLFRLSLGLASSRRILLHGSEGASAAGRVIESFGQFVVGGNYVVGFVLFLALIAIQYMVVSHGAVRTAEVTARFTLDAMPGKQMAIDAELNAGMINEAEARARRRSVEQEADFYGAMDGASKFVRGDAIAAILITLINVLGGFAIGILQKGMTVNEALQRFTLLSIGDGLVSQIPALITSTAAGILVTRAAAKEELGSELTKQLLSYPKVMVILTAMLVVFAIVPGLPMFPFLLLASMTGFLAYNLKGQQQDAKSAALGETPGAPAAKGTAASPDKLETLLNLDSLQIELGYGLINLADSRKGGDLLERVTGVRKTFAQEMGVIIPPIRLRDNLQLEANRYRFLLKGNSIVEGELMPGHWLAMNASNSKVVLKGMPTVEPVFKLPATWIAEAERKHAEVSGYTVVDAPSVLVTHLSETVKRNCHEILSRQDVQNLLDNLKTTHPTVVSELIPGQLNVGQVQRILQNLLAEGVSIRNLAGILEKVSDYTGTTKNPDELSEYARRALGAQIVKPYQSEKGGLQAITLDPRLEQQIAQGVRQSPNEITLTMEPKLARHVMDTLSQRLQQLLSAGQPPVVLCAPQIRLAFRRFFETTFSELTVLAYTEVPARVEIQSNGIIPFLE